MNWKRSKRQSMKTDELVKRAEREGYALFAPSDEHWAKLSAIVRRILAGLTDINCWDGMHVLLSMTAFVAVYGAKNEVDSLDAIPRDVFLKNCAERYDAYARKLVVS